MFRAIADRMEAISGAGTALAPYHRRTLILNLKVSVALPHGAVGDQLTATASCRRHTGPPAPRATVTDHGGPKRWRFASARMGVQHNLSLGIGVILSFGLVPGPCPTTILDSMVPPGASHPVGAVSLHPDARAGAPTGGVVIPFGEERDVAGAAIAQSSFDACSKWLELSIRHASDAQVARHSRVTAWEGTDEAAKAAALEWEFETSTQAIVACGIAIDALAATLQSQLELPRSLIEKWPENSAPHYIRITEILGRALCLSPNATKALHRHLSEILRFRDLAVGATTKADALILHPELQTGVEWRLVYFRCENASMIVGATSRLIGQLTAFGKPRDAELQKYMSALRSRIEAIPGYLALTTRPRDSNAPSAVSFSPVDVLPALLRQAG